MDAIEIPIVRASHAADLPYPTYATESSSGVDLCAAVSAPVVLRRGEITLCPTGISVAIPRGFEGQVRPRSGLALKHGVTLVNSPGTIDADYRGEISVILTTMKDEPFRIERGMRIAQLVFCPIAHARFIPVEQLDATQRGAGGFGHTGIG